MKLQFLFGKEVVRSEVDASEVVTSELDASGLAALEVVALEVERDGEEWKVVLPNGATHRIRVTRDRDDVIRIEEQTEASTPGRVFRVPFAELGDGLHFSFSGRTYRFQPYIARRTGAKSRGASGVLTSPMSGIIVDLPVAVGDRVEAYQPLVVIEAMKIMSTLEAPFAGTVQAIHYQVRQQVTHGAPIIEILPIAEGDPK